MHLFKTGVDVAHKNESAKSGYVAYLPHEHEPVDLANQDYQPDVVTLSDGRRHSSNLFDDSDKINTHWLNIARDHLKTKKLSTS